jgi:hypothetical protein
MSLVWCAMTSRPLWLPTFVAALASCRIPASPSSLFSIPRSYAALILVQASPSPPLHLESCHKNFVSAFAKEVGPGPELVSFPSIATQCAGGRYGTGDPNLLLKLSPRLPPLAPTTTTKSTGHQCAGSVLSNSHVRTVMLVRRWRESRFRLLAMERPR